MTHQTMANGNLPSCKCAQRGRFAPDSLLEETVSSEPVAIIAPGSPASAWWDAGPGSPASAWGDAGHLQITAVAYKHLTGQVKDRVDVLLRLNKDYAKWTAGAPDETTAKQWAFVHAATWADDIKMKSYGYTRDTATSATAGQNIGYEDHNQHDYWHYKDNC